MRTLDELRRWCQAAPTGTSLDAHALGGILEAVEDVSVEETAPMALAEPTPPTWRERLWTVPAETRIGVSEVSEALGRPRSWIYARTAREAVDRVPHRKLDGLLVFTAGELRAWIRAREEVIEAGPMESIPAERGLHVV